jgi:hypothetical protein
MSIITHHTALPDTAAKTDFYSIIDNATTTGIVDSDIASNAAISDIKLSSITTSGKVDGSALNNLANIPSGAGAIPVVNLSAIYPVGSIYMNAAVSTNPATLFGFGTWSAITDRIIIGVGSTFTPAGATGGSSTVTLTTNELPAHTHTVATSNTTGGGTTNVRVGVSAQADTPQTTSSSGSGAAFSVMNPYYAAYVWRRTA